VSEGKQGSDFTHPEWAKILKTVMEKKMEAIDRWDWIIRLLADGHPAEMKRIRETCTPFEIAKAFAMEQYVQSAELKDSGA
jgi:hypothetical protein